MISEDVLNDLEAIKNDLYPKQSYEGSWITAENTIEGLRGNVTAEEETTVTVCNKNLIDMAKAVKYQNCTIDEIDTENELIKCTRTNTNNPSLILEVKLPVGTYTLKHNINGQITLAGETEKNNVGGEKKGTFTTTENITEIRIYLDSTYDTEFELNFSDVILQAGEDEIDYVRHQSQEYTGTEFDIKTYSDITHIYNADDINMNAEIRTKEVAE